jgi:putative copper export protein
VATGFFTALNGHAVGMETGVWITVLAHGIHVVAAGLWLGTLALVLMVTSPEAPGDDADVSDGAAFADLIDRFSPMALGAVGVLVTAGLVATWRHVGTPANMLSPYGLVLGLKIGAFVAAAACGWINWRWARPALHTSGAAQRRLRRLAWLEITFGTIAVALTAVLGLLSMPGHDH